MYKFRTKYFNITFIIISAIILATFFYYFLKPKEQVVISLNGAQVKKWVSYVKDNKLYYIDGQGESILLYDKAFKNKNEDEVNLIGNYTYITFTDKDTSFYFLGDIELSRNCGTLCLYDKNKGVEKVAEEVSISIYLSADYKKIAYSKLNGKNTKGLFFSDLYIYETGKTKVKILENCSQLDSFSFSWNTNTVAYTKNNSETKTYQLYIKKQFKDKEFIDEGENLALIQYSDDGNIIAYGKMSNNGSQIYDYYIKESGKKPEHIVASDYFELIPSNFSIYYLGDKDNSNTSGNLYYKELNKAPVKIASEVRNQIYNYNIDYSKQKPIFFQKSDGMVFLLNEKKAPQKLGELKKQDVIIFRGSTTDFIIFSEEERKIKRAIYDKSKKSYVIKDIQDIGMLLPQSNMFQSNKLLYSKTTINNDFELWCFDLTNNAKELIQTISIKERAVTDIGNTGFRGISFSEVIGNSIYYNLNDGLITSLYIKKSGTKPLKIAETNGSFKSYDEDTVYYYDVSGELKDIKYNLYVYKYGKGSELVASEISRVNLPN